MFCMTDSLNMTDDEWRSIGTAIFTAIREEKTDEDRIKRILTENLGNTYQRAYAAGYILGVLSENNKIRAILQANMNFIIADIAGEAHEQPEQHDPAYT